MRKIIVLIVCLSLFTSIIYTEGVMASEQQEDGMNLLENGGFEVYTGSNGVADGWQKSATTESISSFQVVTTPVNSGSRAQQISGSNMLSSGRIQIEQTVDAVVPGRAFTLSARVKVDSLTNAKVQLYADFGDSEDEWLSGERDERYTTSNGYVTMTVTGTVPAEAATAWISVVLRATGNNGSGSLFVDDIDFNYNVADVSAPTAPTGLQATATSGESITLAWTASTDNVGVTGYEISRNGVLVDTVATPGYVDEGLAAATIYTYSIKAIDAAENRSAAAELTVATDGMNLLENGGFEVYTGSNGVANKWYNSATAGSTANFQVVGTPVNSGSSAQQISGSNIPANGRIKIEQTVQTIVPGKPFTLTARLKVDSLTNAKVQLYADFGDSEDEWLSGIGDERVTTSNGYVTMTVTGTVRAEAATAWISVVLRATGNNGSGSLFVDDIDFNYNVADVSAPTAPTGLQATATSADSITLAWTASTDNVGVTGYEISRNGVLVDTVATPGYVDEGLAAATIYTYSIKAIDAAENRSAAAELTVATDGMNLLENGGFEVYTGSNGVANKWYNSATAGSTANFQVVGTPVNSGSSAQQISGSNIPANGRIKIEQTVQTIVPGKPFTLTARLKVDSLTNAKVQLYADFGDSEDEWLSGIGDERVTTSNGYVTMTVTGTVPAEAATAWISVVLRATGNNGSGSLLVDDIDFNYNVADVSAPTAPTGLQATATSGESITLAWTASTDNVGVTGYEISRNGVLVDTVATPGYVDEGLAAATIYTYSIKAIDAAENRSAAAELTVATDGMNLLENGGFEVYTGSNGVANKWYNSATAGSTANFQVVGTPVNSGSSAQQISGSNIPANGRIKIEQTVQTIVPGKPFTLTARLKVDSLTNAKVQLYADFGDSEDEWLSGIGDERVTTSNGYVTMTVTGTVPAEAATAWISVVLRATGNNGSGSLLVDDMLLVYGTLDVIPPTVPQDLRITNWSDSAISIAWDPSTDDSSTPVSYEVWRLDSNNIFTVQHTAYTEEGLTKDEAYTFRVRAKDADGNTSDWSDELTGYTDTEAPEAPADISIRWLTSSAVRITWSPSTDNVSVVKYRLELEGAVLDGVTVDEVEAPLTEYELFDLVYGQVYTISITAIDAMGNESESASLSFKPLQYANPTYSYDGNNRLNKITFSSGLIIWFEYDPGGNLLRTYRNN